MVYNLDTPIEQLRDALREDVQFASSPSTVKDIVGDDDVRIAFGYRPSGIIHLGNITTFLLAAQTAIKLGTYRSTLVATNQDLDLIGNRKFLPEDLGLSLSKRKSYCPVFKYALTETGNSHADEYGALVEDFLGEISSYTGITLEIHRMSEINKDKEFRGLVKNVCDNYKKILPYFDDEKSELLEKTKGGYLLHPLHPKHNVTNWRGSSYNDGIVTMETPHLGGKLQFDINDLDYAFGVHFLLSPLRDLTEKYHADVHIHGGDRVDDCDQEFTKIQKTAAVMNVAAEGKKVPILTVGPMIYGNDNIKMSKSLSNGLTLQTLRDINGAQTLPRLMEYSKYIIDSGMGVIDFSVTDEKLLRK